MAAGLAATFPRAPDAAAMLGVLYQRLGGFFSIDSSGRRGMGRAFEPVHESAIPQLPQAKPHQRLLNAEHWEGAMRLIEGCLSALDPEDKAFLFDLFAVAAVDPRAVSSSVEEPRRRPRPC